nr:hypothetical protein [uncultured Rhodopila sp.]
MSRSAGAPKPRKSRAKARRSDLLDILDTLVSGLESMIGRWFDSIPPEVRAELRTLREPAEAALIAEGRRGQQGTARE